MQQHNEPYYDGEITIDLDAYPRKATWRHRTNRDVEPVTRCGDNYDEAIESVKAEVDRLIDCGS